MDNSATSQRPAFQPSPLRSCEHRDLTTDGVRCSLIPNTLFAGPWNPNCICRDCHKVDSLDGKPCQPSAVAAHFADLAARPKSAAAAMNRHPSACDHSGIVLRGGDSCVSRIYECDARDDGEANCVTCRDCPDFVPIGNG
jgi:hypothetical protein